MGDYMRIEANSPLVTSAVSVESGASEEQPEEKDDETAKADRLQKEVLELRKKETTYKHRLDEAKSFWENKVDALSREVEEIKSQAQAREVELKELQNPNNELATPKRLPGCKCLRWVLGPTFACVTSVVIVANMLTMFAQRYYSDELKPYHEEVVWASNFYLGFYVLELLLKVAVLHCKFLCGPPCVVWWNWMDVLIVLIGVVEQWLVPLAEAYGYIDLDNTEAMMLLQHVRAFRMVRVLKIFHGCMTSDFSWTEEHRFQLFMMGVIGFNSLTIAMQEDYGGLPCWSFINGTLLVIYTFELIARLAHWGCRFFVHAGDWGWNWLDLIIVVGGMVNQWAEPAIMIYRHCAGLPALRHSDLVHLANAKHGKAAKIMMIMRLARLLRILRLVRLVRSVQPLYTLVLGIVSAMQGMVWVMILTTLFLYLWAILGVVLVGHGLIFDGAAPVEVAKIFPDVPESMYVLFKVMNGDMGDLEPLFEVVPITKLVCVLFMVISTWAILSILTAVVSENMITATEQHRAELEQDTVSDKTARSRQKLEEIFIGTDTNKDNSLSREEFNQMLEDTNRTDELSEACGLEKADMVHIFDLLASTDVVDGEIVLTIKRADFVEGLQRESASVTERAIMRLEKRLSLIEKGLREVERKAVKEGDRMMTFMDTVDGKLESIKDASSTAPLLAAVEQRFAAGEAAAAAAAKASAEQAAEMQRILARLEQRVADGAAAAREAQVAAQGATQSATQAAQAAAEAAQQAVAAATAAAGAAPRPAAAEAVLVSGSLQEQYQCEVEGLHTASDAVEAAAAPPAAAWEVKTLFQGEEDPPLPVPQPRFAAAPAGAAGARPAGTGEEPFAALRGDRPDILDPLADVDPLDHLLN